MKDNFEDRNCIPGQKPFYKVAEAAILWCNIQDREVHVDDKGLPENDPANPCLRNRGMMIFDAIENNEIPHGRDGKKVKSDDHVAWGRRTVRHNDLKKWMAENLPDQKPVFLFDEIERNTHSAFNAKSFQALQIDRDALQQQLDCGKDKITALEVEKDEIVAKLKQYESICKRIDGSIAPRSEKTYLNIIAALLDCVTGPYKDKTFSSETKLREFIDENYDGIYGLKERTLGQKFADAKKTINEKIKYLK